MENFETTICDAKLNHTQLEKHVEHIHGGNKLPEWENSEEI